MRRVCAASGADPSAATYSSRTVAYWPVRSTGDRPRRPGFMFSEVNLGFCDPRLRAFSEATPEVYFRELLLSPRRNWVSTTSTTGVFCRPSRPLSSPCRRRQRRQSEVNAPERTAFTGPFPRWRLASCTCQRQPSSALAALFTPWGEINRLMPRSVLCRVAAPSRPFSLLDA